MVKKLVVSRFVACLLEMRLCSIQGPVNRWNLLFRHCNKLWALFLPDKHDKALKHSLEPGCTASCLID